VEGKMIGNLTLLFPATKHDPSKARLTERIGVLPAGVLITCRAKSGTLLRLNFDHAQVRESIYCLIGPTA